MASKNAAARAQAWRIVAEDRRQHPGRWALVTDDAHSSTATHIIQGRIAAFRPAGDFQAMVRGSVNGRGPLYVRYSPTDNPNRSDHV